MKLSDYKGEEALDILADLIDPVVEISSDKEIATHLRAREITQAVKAAIKNHKKAIIEILAVLDGEDPATYEPGVFALPTKLLEILNDPEFINLFQPQGQTTDETSSGSATVNTEESEH